MKPAAPTADERARLAALDRYEILDTPPEREFDDLARLAAQICDAPFARVAFVDAEREWFKARVGGGEDEGPRETSFCGHAISGREMLIVPDARTDERFADNPLVTRVDGFRFYAGAPLVTPDGYALGTICVMDRRPRELRPEQAEGLRRLARLASLQLELRRRLLEETAEAREALRQTEANLALVASQMPAVLWSTDRELVLTSSRGKALGAMNERPGQYVGVPLTEYFHTNDPEFLPLVAHRRALLGESVAFEVEWLGRTFAAHVEPMRTPEGAIAGVIGAALDVTRQKQAEGELRKSVALLQATLDAAADGVLVVDHEGKVISANRRFREMWRIPDEIAEANDPRRLLAHVAEQLKDQTGFLKKVLGVSATRDDEPPALLDLTDGRLFERTSRPHAVGGETLGRVWTFRDVTARHEIERELEQSLALLKATLDATADGVLVVDSAGRVVSFNRRFLEMWRIPEPLARSRDDNQLLAFVLDQLKDPDRFVKKVRELYGRPDAQSYDWLEFEDGRVFERYSTPHEVGGKVVGRVWSFRDVSDRARMENVLRRDARTFEHLFDAVVVMDLTAKVLDCNPGAERLFGSAREDIVGKNLPVEEIAPRALGPEQRLAEMRRLGRWSGEIAFRRRDGTEGLCETVVVPLWDDFGRTVGALQISRDVNGRTKREAPPAG